MTYNADSVLGAQFTSCYVIHYNEKCENSISTRSSLDHSRHSLHCSSDASWHYNHFSKLHCYINIYLCSVQKGERGPKGEQGYAGDTGAQGQQGKDVSALCYYMYVLSTYSKILRA